MAYEKRRFTEEQIQFVNNINLLEYAKQSFDVKKVGTNSYKIEGHGGLHINPETNKWNCFSQSKGGGPIQFVMFTENKSWVEAVKQLLGVSSSNTYVNRKDFSREEPKGKLILPEKNSTYKHMMAYLIRTRKIDKDIVYRLVKDKKLYEDKYKNCVFVGYNDKGEAGYASIRGTNTNVERFRGDVKNSDKAYSFCMEGIKNSTKIYVFESPIDLMSYLTIRKLDSNNSFKLNDHLLSLGGLSDKALEKYLIKHPNIKEINLCLDNDREGIMAANRLREKYKDRFVVNIEHPNKKDYNEDLKNLSIVDERKEKDVVNQESKVGSDNLKPQLVSMEELNRILDDREQYGKFIAPIHSDKSLDHPDQKWMAVVNLETEDRNYFEVSSDYSFCIKWLNDLWERERDEDDYWLHR